MKKIQLLLAMLFVVVFSTLAQDSATYRNNAQPSTYPASPVHNEAQAAGITIKPTVGINLTDVSKLPNGSAQAKVGWQIGGSVMFGHFVFIEPGVFYVGKSTQFTSTAANSIAKIDLNGIRVPVSVGVNLIGHAAPVGVRVFGGGSAFFITSTSDDLPKALVNTTQWGLHAGVGLDIFIVFIDASYEWSLTNIQKDISEIDVGKSRSLFINAGIRIPL